MRYSSNHKAETRQRIIDEASRRLRSDGIDGTGLVPLMKALGLTHGGFYAHFESKDALVQAALEFAAGQSLDKWQGPDAPADVAILIDRYLSPRHRDNPGDGCPLPTLSAELGIRGRPSPTSDMLVEQMSARLAEVEVRAAPADQGLVALAMLVGALTLARAVADGDTSQHILDAARAALHPPPLDCPLAKAGAAGNPAPAVPATQEETQG
ncbi:TetR/AcrR family transcriptional regulator [Massilia sp. 9096]|uniref:TetR/AcrR family transcriptional regulator n=1 Tax=Massilia sp. 9096 TaxID=1500894 RepID=UPI0009DFC5EE|nr:TetR/AcrR family transcriptional regulator [Massilia sp. 9096]